MFFWDTDSQENKVVKQKHVNKHSQQHTWDWFHSVLHRLRLPYWYCSLHDVQLLLNKQQQIWGAVYIHWHFSSSTDTVVLPNFDLNQSNLTPKWNYIRGLRHFDGKTWTSTLSDVHTLKQRPVNCMWHETKDRNRKYSSHVEHSCARNENNVTYLLRTVAHSHGYISLFVYLWFMVRHNCNVFGNICEAHIQLNKQ